MTSYSKHAGGQKTCCSSLVRGLRTLRKPSVAIHVEAARGDTFLRGDVNIWRLVFVSLITRAGAPEGAVHGRLGRSRLRLKELVRPS